MMKKVCRGILVIAAALTIGCLTSFAQVDSSSRGGQPKPAVEHRTPEAPLQFPGMRDRVWMITASAVLLGGLLFLLNEVRKRADRERGLG